MIEEERQIIVVTKPLSMKVLNSLEQKNNGEANSIVPFSFKKHLYVFTIPEFRKDDYGSYLSQKIETEDFHFYFFRFEIYKTVTLLLSSDKPVIGLNYMIYGNIPIDIPRRGRKILEEGHYEMLYVPVTKNELTLEPGVYESCWLEVLPKLITDMAEKYVPIKLLYQLLEEGSLTGQASIKAKINLEVKMILKDMLLYRSTMTKEKMETWLRGCVYKLLSSYDDTIKALEYIGSLSLSKLEGKLVQIQYYIAENACIHDCSLIKLAEKFNIPKSTLKRNFNKKFGMPVSKYVQKQCMERAKKLLDMGADSVESIAYDLGYENYSNFSNAFKKYFKLSPQQIRKII